MNKQLKGSNPNPATAKRLTCKDIADILIKTYNPSIIDFFIPELKDSCEQEALEIISKSDNYMHRTRRGRQVLANLISNRKNPHTKVDFVGGPFNITHHWSNKYKKSIYIWGEIHDEIIDCPKQDEHPDMKIMNIEDFLRDIFFINPIAFSDFYLEMEAHIVPWGYPKYEYDPKRLVILRSLFAKCIGPNRDLDKLCNNSRMHFFDIRQGQVKWGMNSTCLFSNEIISFLSYANSKLKEHKDTISEDDPELLKLFEKQLWDEYCLDFTFLEEISYFIERWKSFFIFFALFNNNYEDTKLNYKKFWYDQIYNFKLLGKEITVMHTEVKPLLNIFIKKELESLLSREHIKLAEYSKRVLYIYESIKKLFNTPVYTLQYREIKELIDSINSVYQFILPFNTLTSDGYLLARVFKIFKVDNNLGYNPRKTDEPAEPHNIIIYAGNAHSQRYRLFLKYLGFNLIEQSGELEKLSGIYKNCVDIRHINQPFFSKWYNIEDNRMDENYFDNLELYFSFESVFRFYEPEVFIPFDQPVVPSDLVSQVSINDHKYYDTW